MDEQSILSDGKTRNFLGEVFDANIGSSSHQSSKFKGVVSKPNGHWGAQICSGHLNIWLGTFMSENEAAMAYDSAAILLCDEQLQQRNFPWTNITAQEPNFQSQFSEEAVLTMIKDGSYATRFSYFMRSQEEQGHDQFSVSESSQSPGMKITCLFQKVLTPSDVGNLNPLVIPKRYALKHFPAISKDNKNDKETSCGILLNFYDPLMNLWPFRYCYWTSSQSYVFTMGWYEFARENRLRAGDRVIISCGECNNQKIYIIEVAYYDGAIMNGEGGHDAIPGIDGSGNVETRTMQSQDDDSEVVERCSLCPWLWPCLQKKRRAWF